MYNTCNSSYGVSRSTSGCLYNGQCGASYCNYGCGNSWWNSGYQSICRDCCGNIRVNTNCQHCCSCCNVCGNNGSTPENNTNGNSTNNGFSCVTFCGYNNGNAAAQGNTNNGYGYSACNRCGFGRCNRSYWTN